MTRRVFNYGGGMHSPAALTQLMRDALSGEVADGLDVVAGSGMNVTVNAGTALVGRDPSYNINVIGTETVNVGAASPSNPINAVIVAYVDRNVAGDQSATDNTNDVFKLKAISGAAASNPADPTNSAIQAAIGASNPFIILARVKKRAGATAISSNDITDLRKMMTLPNGRINNANLISDGTIESKNIKDGSILPQKLKTTDMLSFSANNSAQTVSGSLVIQSGWVYFLGNGGKQQSVQVTFPKKFKEVYAVIPTLIGYTRNTPTSPESFDQKIGAGTNIECGSFNQTGTTITASTSGIFGGANHGISWIAIGTI